MFLDLRRKWEAEDCIYTPATMQDIELFELQNEVHLPKDFRSYFLELNGTKTDGDSQLLEFAPLNKLQTWRHLNWTTPPQAPSGFDADKMYIFCDYMISSWAYAICLDASESKGGKVTSYGWITEEIIAPSFSAFIDLYLADDRSIYPPSTTPFVSDPFVPDAPATQPKNPKSWWPRR
ncbi:hypothetical protein BH10ACI4_BH10ACI4_18520 [soil metagenome]